MTDNPDGDCFLAQGAFAEAQKTYRQTGHVPGQIAVQGDRPGAPVVHFSCAILMPANEVTCTSAQYDAQFLLSALKR